MAKRNTRRSSKTTASRKKATASRKASRVAGGRAKTSARSKPQTRAAKTAVGRKASKSKVGTKPKAAAKSKAQPKSAAKVQVKKASTARRAKAPAVQAGPKAVRPKRAPKDTRPIVQSPPSSLDMNRRGSAARTGRVEMAESRAEHATMTPSITGGDVDASVEDAYFTGDEAPGGDNPTPDQDVVDEIGKALGVEYQDNEELRGSDKLADRDKHRWELDPASAEDYRDRK